MTSTAQADFEVSGGGSLYILTPLNPEARQHLQENVSEEALMGHWHMREAL